MEHRMRKKYCIDCKNIIEEGPREWGCNHPDNIQIYDTPLQQEKRRKRTLYVINKDNKCPWYKRKRFKNVDVV
jgi:hypothetical protein